MAKKPTLKHRLPNGEIATRQTARAYTHVVVGTFDYKGKREEIELKIAQAKPSPNHISNYEFLASRVAAGPERTSPYLWETAESIRRDYERAVEALAGASNATEFYVAQKRNELAEMMLESGGADRGQPVALAWSSRKDLADKEALKWQGNRFTDAHAEVINNGL